MLKISQIFIFWSVFLSAQEKIETATIQNENFRVKIELLGAQLISFKNKNSNREYIWQRNPEFWKQSSPVLFPFVGKLWEGGYYYNGKKYEMTNHGFANQSKFEVTSHRENEVWLSLKDSPQTLSKYPFKFVFKVGYILEGNELKVVFDIKNNGNIVMPFQVGGHPGFNLPNVSSELESVKGYLRFKTVGNSLSYIIKEKNNFFLKEPKQHTLSRGSQEFLPITQNLFKDDALVFENYQARAVTIYDKNEKPFVRVDFDMPVFALWSLGNRNAPFICIEPWWGRGDKENFTKDFRERDWTPLIAPNEKFITSYTIKILN